MPVSSLQLFEFFDGDVWLRFLEVGRRDVYLRVEVRCGLLQRNVDLVAVTADIAEVHLLRTVSAFGELLFEKS